MMLRMSLALTGFVLSSLLEAAQVPGTPEPGEFKVRPGETAAEWEERCKQLNERLDREREEAMEARKRAAAEEHGTAPGGSTRPRRTETQARNVERAASEFEAAKRRLFRADGSQVFSDEEHQERLGKLAEGLREKIGAVAAEARSDAEGHERDALALSYADPAAQVPSYERGRLEASRAFVKEDCEALPPAALIERLAAVSAGSDKMAKVLHARYARTRLETLKAESAEFHRQGRSTGPEAARLERALGEAVAALEADLADPRKAKRAEELKEAAEESRRAARAAMTRLSELDGTDAAARKRQHQATVRNF